MTTAVELALANALEEVTLVCFTTLGPSSVLAFLLMLAVWARPDAGCDERALVRKLLWVPLALCMLSLIASATHLGSAENALYVLTHVGSSPLSNEVLASVAFLALAALFWILGFTTDEHLALARVHAVLTALAGLVAIAAISYAYNVATIVTWSQPCVPASIAASAGVAGPLIALAALRPGRPEPHSTRYTRALAVLFTLASCVWLALCAVYGAQLATLGNSLYAATDLVPMYWPCWAMAAVLLLTAFALAAWPLLRTGQVTFPRLLTATALSLAAIFIMRFLFYMTHMTVGLTI